MSLPSLKKEKDSSLGFNCWTYYRLRGNVLLSGGVWGRMEWEVILQSVIQSIKLPTSGRVREGRGSLLLPWPLYHCSPMGKQSLSPFPVKLLRVVEPSVRRSWATLITYVVYACSGLISWQVDQQMWVPHALLSWVICFQGWVKGNLAWDLCFASFVYIPFCIFFSPLCLIFSPFPASLHSLQIVGLQQTPLLMWALLEDQTFSLSHQGMCCVVTLFRIAYEGRLASLFVRIWTCPRVDPV